MRIRKREIDVEVAILTGKPINQVTKITKAFFEVAMRHLVDMKDVRFDGFGELHPYFQRGRTDMLTTGFAKSDPLRAVTTERKYRVTFKQAVPLKRAVRAEHGGTRMAKEEEMTKLGVDEGSSELEKRAQQGCPNCGTKVERHGNVLACPKCGTEPFENK